MAPGTQGRKCRGEDACLGVLCMYRDILCAEGDVRERLVGKVGPNPALDQTLRHGTDVMLPCCLVLGLFLWTGVGELSGCTVLPVVCLVCKG